MLIDIGARSVAGAYARYAQGEAPTLLYTRRLPIEFREQEPHERAMLRALEILGRALVREGAPALLRATGSGRCDTMLVSVDAPWQKTSVRTEHLEQERPFTFSRSLVAATLEKSRTAPAGKVLVDESVIGTILNGYETRDPYGKQVKRASIVVLTSLIDERVANGISAIIRGLYHGGDISSIAGSSLRYQAIRIAFPHERDALILDATGMSASLALVRKNLLVDVSEVEDSSGSSAAWMKKVAGELAKLSGRFPLPHTIFLLAREPEISSIQETLDAADLGTLWLSEHPPKIVPVLASHLLGSSVRQAAPAPADLSLLLMALYWSRRVSEGGL